MEFLFFGVFVATTELEFLFLVSTTELPCDCSKRVKQPAPGPAGFCTRVFVPARDLIVPRPRVWFRGGLRPGARMSRDPERPGPVVMSAASAQNAIGTSIWMMWFESYVSPSPWGLSRKRA